MVSDTHIDISMLHQNSGGGTEIETTVSSNDGSVEIVETQSGDQKNYDLSIDKKLDNWKQTDTDIKEAVESAKMAHLYIVENFNGSVRKVRMFSQFDPYSSSYTETRIGLYAILRQEDKILGAGHFVLSYGYKGGVENVDLYYHGLAGTKNVADYIKVKHITHITQSQRGEICLYADFGDLNNKSCSISFSINARNSLSYFDFTGMNTSVNYEADYVAQPLPEIGMNANNVSFNDTAAQTGSNNVQGAVDSIAEKVAKKVKYIHFAPTDETLINFTFVDLNELNEIARAGKNNEDFIVYAILLYQGGLQTKITPISQGDSFDGSHFILTSCVDLYLLGLTDNPVQNLSVRINIPYQIPSQSEIYAYLSEIAMTPSDYEQFTSQIKVVDNS